MVLHGRAGQGNPVLGAQRPGGPGLPGGRVLDVLRLVQHDAPPRHLGDEPDVPRQHPVAGRDDGVLTGRLHEFGVPSAARTVMHHQRQVGREPGGLLAPVVDHRGRADQERRFLYAFLSVLLDRGQGLDRFAQPHVVGQAGAQPPAPQEGQPGIAPLLVGAQRSAEPIRSFQLLELGPSGELPQQVLQPAAGRHAVHVQPTRRLPGAHRQPDDVFQRDLALPVPEIQRRPDLAGVELHPLAAQLHQRRFQLGQRLQLPGAHDLVSQRHLKVQLQGMVANDTPPPPCICGVFTLALTVGLLLAPRRDHHAGRMMP